MKIAIVTEVSHLYVNGVSRTVSRLLDHLIENNHETMVFGPDSGNYKSVKLMGTFGIPLFFYPELKLNFALPHLIFSLVKFKPDVIHFVDPNLFCPQMIFLCRLFLPNVPYVSSYHTNIALYATMFGFGFLYEPIWATHRLYHGCCKKVLCPSNSTKQTLVENGFDSEKVGIWSRGVDMELFNPSRRDPQLRESWLAASKKALNLTPTSSLSSNLSSPSRRESSSSLKDEGVAFGYSSSDDKIILLYVGRISWEKNIRVLVETYKKMNHEQFHLVIVGDGPAKQSIEDDLRHSDVTFTGYLKGEKLAAAYASADIFTFPSKSETFGQVVLEALSSGLPVVSLEAEGVKEIVQNEKSGFLVPPNDDENTLIANYQEAIERIAESNELRASMSYEASKRAKTFSWTGAMQICLDTYEEVTRSPQLLTQ